MSQGATSRGVPGGNGKAVDWEAIERDYRVGVLSIRELGKLHGIPYQTIQKRAKRLSWTRDLTERVKVEVQRRLTAVSAQGVTPGVTPYTGDTVTRKANENEIVQAAAATAVEVVRSHRRDISVGRFVSNVLMGQLMEAAESRDDLEKAIIAETEDGAGTSAKDAARARAGRAQMLKAISLPQHAATLRDLSTAMKNFVALERTAFNIPDAPPADPPAADDQATLTDYSALRRLLLEDKSVVAG